MAELNGKFVNEANHQKVKTKLQKIGYVLLGVGAVFCIIGIVLLILGFTSIGKTVEKPLEPGMPNIGQGFSSSVGFFAGGGILLTIGLGMLAFGVYASFFAHAREIAAYASTVAPVVGETATYLADETSPAIQKVTSAISNGIRGKQPNENAETQSQSAVAPNPDIKFCTACGAKNTREAKFCTKCGHKF